MKIASLFILILVLGLSTFAQKNIESLKKERKSFKHNKYYAVGYDKFKDLSTISFNGSAIGSKKSFMFGGALVVVSVEFYFKGQELKETPQEFILRISGYSQGIKNNIEGTLYVLADNKRFEYKEGLGQYHISQDILGDLNTMQSLRFVIDRDDIQTFANAKELEMKVGDKPYKIDAKRQQVFKDILTISKIND